MADATTAPRSSSAPPVVGVSPGRDAWRRLRRNRAAMIGLGLLVVVVTACIAAPLVSPHDPALAREWLGARPPGFSHPGGRRSNVLEVGLPPPMPALSSLIMEVDDSVYLYARVRIDAAGVVTAITVQQGEADDVAGVVERLPDLARLEMSPRPGVWHAVPETVMVEQGAVLPQALGTGPSRQVMLRGSREPRHVVYGAVIEQGVVSAISRDGEAVDGAVVPGDRLVAVVVDGRPYRIRHLLGTDDRGRDLAARVLHGGRISLLVGIVGTLVSVLIGVTYGAVAGYAGGRVDRVMMSVIDVLYALPFMFLVILLLAFFGNNIFLLFAALGAVQWLTMARIVRAQVMSLRHREFIDAARLAGCRRRHLLWRHLIPNSLGPIIVYATLTVPLVMLEESFLSFIGLTIHYGGRPIDSWGALVKSGMEGLGTDGSASWLLLVPAGAMGLTLLALNIVGDGLRDAFDPQLRGRT